MRSVWKSAYGSNIQKIGPTDERNSDLYITSTRFSLVRRSDLNKRMNIYNGKTYISMIMRRYMVGSPYSMYVAKKYTGKNIHVKKKKKKKK